MSTWKSRSPGGGPTVGSSAGVDDPGTALGGTEPSGSLSSLAAPTTPTGTASTAATAPQRASNERSIARLYNELDR